MTDSGSRRGAANLAPVLMIVAFAAMVGLLFWLNMEAEDVEQQAAMVQEDTVEVADTAGTGGAQAVSAMELRTATDTYEGQLVRVSDVPVAMGVSSQIFMVDLGEEGQQALFPVHLDSALVARGETAPSAGTVAVAGTVFPVSDSILSVWVEAGAMTEGDRPIVGYATHYVDARRVEAGGGSGGP